MWGRVRGNGEGTALCGILQLPPHGSQEPSGSAVALATSLHQKGRIETGQVRARLWITPQCGDEAKVTSREEGRGDIYFNPISPTVEQSLKPDGRAVHLCVVEYKCGKSE